MNRRFALALPLTLLAAFLARWGWAQQYTRPLPMPMTLCHQSMPHYGIETTFTLLPSTSGQDSVRMRIRAKNFPARYDETDGTLLSSGTQDPRTPEYATLTLGSNSYDIGPPVNGVLTLTLPRSEYDSPQSIELTVFDSTGTLVQGIGPYWYYFF